MNEFPDRLHHVTPNWVEDNAVFHIRVRVDAREQVALTNPILAGELVSAVQRYHGLGRWHYDLFLIMPDHVHAMLAFAFHTDLAVVMRDWKRGTARFQGIKWQDNFFDHRIRSSKESRKTWHYIRRNPVVKELCANEEEWPWWWSGTLDKKERADYSAFD